MVSAVGILSRLIASYQFQFPSHFPYHVSNLLTVLFATDFTKFSSEILTKLREHLLALICSLSDSRFLLSSVLYVRVVSYLIFNMDRCKNKCESVLWFIEPTKEFRRFFLRHQSFQVPFPDEVICSEENLIPSYFFDHLGVLLSCYSSNEGVFLSLLDLSEIILSIPFRQNRATEESLSSYFTSLATIVPHLVVKGLKSLVSTLNFFCLSPISTHYIPHIINSNILSYLLRSEFIRDIQLQMTTFLLKLLDGEEFQNLSVCLSCDILYYFFQTLEIISQENLDQFQLLLDRIVSRKWIERRLIEEAINRKMNKLCSLITLPADIQSEIFSPESESI